MLLFIVCVAICLQISNTGVFDPEGSSPSAVHSDVSSVGRCCILDWTLHLMAAGLSEEIGFPKDIELFLFATASGL